MTEKLTALAATALLLSACGTAAASDDPTPKPIPTIADPVVAYDVLPDVQYVDGGFVLGSSWVPLPAKWVTAMSNDGPDGPAGYDTRDWAACSFNLGDTSFIVCPDGFTESS